MYINALDKMQSIKSLFTIVWWLKKTTTHTKIWNTRNKSILTSFIEKNKIIHDGSLSEINVLTLTMSLTKDTLNTIQLILIL